MAKTYTAAGSAVAGDVYTAAAHNIIVTDVNNLIVKPMVQTTAVNTATVLSNTGTSPVQFNGASTIDTDAMTPVVANYSRFPITTTGMYAVSAYLTMNSGVGEAILFLTAGGTNFALNGSSGIVTGGQVRVGISGVGFLSSGSYLSFAIYQNTGADRTPLTAGFSAVWIGRSS